MNYLFLNLSLNLSLKSEVEVTEVEVKIKVESVLTLAFILKFDIMFYLFFVSTLALTLT